MKKMKKASLIAIILITATLTSNAQIADSISGYEIDLGESKKQCFQEDHLNNGFGFGAQLSQYQTDVGIGLNISSPFFAFERIAFRIRGNFMVNEHVLNTKTIRSPYSNLSFGFVGASGKVGNYIKIYGEGGLLVLFPSEKFSSEQVVSGGYGLLGIEFFTNRFSDYFLEIGHVGSGAREDKIAGQPFYSNGLIISTGLRLYLK